MAIEESVSTFAITAEWTAAVEAAAAEASMPLLTVPGR